MRVPTKRVIYRSNMRRALIGASIAIVSLTAGVLVGGSDDRGKITPATSERAVRKSLPPCGPAFTGATSVQASLKVVGGRVSAAWRGRDEYEVHVCDTEGLLRSQRVLVIAVGDINVLASDLTGHRSASDRFDLASGLLAKPRAADIRKKFRNGMLVPWRLPDERAAVGHPTVLPYPTPGLAAHYDWTRTRL